MSSRIHDILHALTHAPVQFPVVVADCGNFSLVAIGHQIIKVSNAVIRGVGLVVATDITLRGL